MNKREQLFQTWTKALQPNGNPYATPCCHVYHMQNEGFICISGKDDNQNSQEEEWEEEDIDLNSGTQPNL